MFEECSVLMWGGVRCSGRELVTGRWMFAVAGSSSLRGFEVGRPPWFQGGILSLVRGKVRQCEEGEGGSGDEKGCGIVCGRGCGV